MALELSAVDVGAAAPRHISKVSAVTAVRGVAIVFALTSDLVRAGAPSLRSSRLRQGLPTFWHHGVGGFGCHFCG